VNSREYGYTVIKSRNKFIYKIENGHFGDSIWVSTFVTSKITDKFSIRFNTSSETDSITFNAVKKNDKLEIYKLNL